MCPSACGAFRQRKNKIEQSFDERGRGLIRKKEYLILAVVFVAALVVGGIIALAVYGVDRNSIAVSASARAEIGSAAPVVNEVPDFAGYTLTVLCDAAGSDAFAVQRENETSISRAVAMRDRHLCAETGVEIRATVAADFLTAARESLLSGDGAYQLYAADAAGALAPLMVENGLCDLSADSRVTRDGAGVFVSAVDGLSIYGKRYLLAATAQDVYRGVYCVAYNRRLAEELADLFPDGQSLPAAALDGTFTLEQLAVAARAAQAAYPDEERGMESADVAALDVQARFYGLALDVRSVFPLAFGVGGGFIEVLRGSPSVIEYERLSAVTDALRPLLTDAATSLVGDDFFAGGSLFCICKIGDIAAGRATLGDVGILPMPKGSAAEPYRAYLELRGTPLLALPRGADVLRTTYLCDRAAFLSRGYVEPLLRRSITGDSADDGAVLSLIEGSIAADLTGLLGYGDIPSYYAAAAQGSFSAPHLEYYNRKTFYEKALSIIEKRLK